MWERSRSFGVMCLLVFAGACNSGTTGITNPLDGGDVGGQQAGGDTSVGDATTGDPGVGDTSGDGSTGDGASGGDGAMAFSCASCHGNDINNAPPVGLAGRTALSETGIGAHQSHVLSSTWHRVVACTECHIVPAAIGDTGHIDTPLPAELTWNFPADADGASVDWNGDTCSNYCHGQTLEPGGTLLDPQWTTVDGSQAACGTCHGLPPGGSHTTSSACEVCHGEVIASFAPTVVWTDPSRHIDGVKDATSYHDLANWIAPRDGSDHHGSNYFLTNQQRDEHDSACTLCHGANLDGGSARVSCDTVCHGGDWRACDFCHGNPPPDGVGGETTTDTLAVGRHTVHLTPSSSHAAFTCATCHVIPATGDVAHAIDYLPSADLDSAGHHGDVSFSGQGSGTTWDVTNTVGAPVSARGSCTGACHSNGRGGPPRVTPRWAGGAWTTACDNCHDDPPNSGEHDKHVNDEGAGCGVCHAGPVATNHFNGEPDVNLGGGAGSIVVHPDGCGPGQLSCSGVCHSESHNASDECW